MASIDLQRTARRSGSRVVLICLVLGNLPPVAVQAAPARERPALSQAMSACRPIADVATRATCYDKALDAFDQAQAEGRIVVVDREQVRAVRRQSFGSAAAPLSPFAHGAKDESLDRMTVELTGAGQAGDGKWVMTTTDDAVWRQTDDALLNKLPHHGSKVVISKGMIGGFFCEVDGQPVIRCARQ